MLLRPCLSLPTAFPATTPYARHLLTLLQLLLCSSSACAWFGDITHVLPAKVESPGKLANTISLDCSGSGLAIHVIDATYGTPCNNDYKGCTTAVCAAVKPGNYVAVMVAECEGKTKCDVSTCPCPKTDTCAPQAKSCSPDSVGPMGDPAHGCPKGATVVYRCGAVSWGAPFLLCCALVGGAYLSGGTAYAAKLQGSKPAAGSGEQSMPFPFVPYSAHDLHGLCARLRA